MMIRNSIAIFCIITLVACAHNKPLFITEGQPRIDVIIIGAGMAGLSAARELKEANKSFLVLEAQGRIGGRTMVDKNFAVPVDLGAAWLHGVDDNPLVPIADEMGFTRVDTNLDGPIYVRNRKATADERQACEKIYEEVEEGMKKQGTKQQDIPVSDLLPAREPCADLVASNIGPFENGAEISKVSSITAGKFETGNDDFLQEGIGTFVEEFGKDIPVRLNSVVNKIEYGPTGVRVSLATGEQFLANRVLVTVSTGVLQAGKIKFEPALPKWKLVALDKLPMGLLNKVILQFKKDIFKDTPNNSWVLWDGPGDDNLAFVIRPLSAPIAVAFYGGEQAKEFEKDEKAALLHAKYALRQMYGDEVDKQFKSSGMTRWGSNPWTLGSYSYVVPGASDMYKELQKPVEDRVFFAGEACARPEFNASLHGAYESGVQATNLIVKSLAH